MEKPPSHITLAQKLIGVLTGFLGHGRLAGAVYFGLGWVKTAFPGMTLWGGVAVPHRLPGAHHHRRQAPRPEVDDPNAPMLVLPRAGEVAVTGLHFLLPIVVLLWCILVERLSPALSAYLGHACHDLRGADPAPPQGSVRGTTRSPPTEWRRGIMDFWDGMIAGARNMIPSALPPAWPASLSAPCLSPAAPGGRRVCRVPVRRQPDPDAAAGGGHEPDPRHGPADHRQLHRGVVADGAGDRVGRRAVRASSCR
jgi:hypothetical protein